MDFNDWRKQIEENNKRGISLFAEASQAVKIPNYEVIKREGKENDTDSN